MQQTSDNSTSTIDASIEILQRRLNWKIYRLENPELVSIDPNTIAELSDRTQRIILRIYDYYSKSYIINDGFDKDHTARREFSRTQDGEPARALKKLSKICKRD